MSGAPALGLTHIQSSDDGAGRVPFVSTATSNPRACSSSISFSSTWRSGSPPVHTTYFRAPSLPALDSAGAPPPQHRSIASASSFAPLNLPPSGPVPTKSVSQNLHTARERSSSRPDQRLQPE